VATTQVAISEIRYMKNRILRFKDIAQIAVSLLIAIAAGADMIGQPARLVHVLALSAGALGAGMGLGVYLGKRSEQRRALRDEEQVKN